MNNDNISSENGANKVAFTDEGFTLNGKPMDTGSTGTALFHVTKSSVKGA